MTQVKFTWEQCRTEDGVPEVTCEVENPVDNYCRTQAAISAFEKYFKENPHTPELRFAPESYRYSMTRIGNNHYIFAPHPGSVKVAETRPERARMMVTVPAPG